MTWAVLLPIIAQYGIPLAEKLFQKWTSGNPPTQADFDELRAEASRTAQDEMKSVLVNAGFSLSDPKVQALLGLTAAPPVVGAGVEGPTPVQPVSSPS
jgi:hypothetical protein